MEPEETHFDTDFNKHREKFEEAIVRLKSMRGRVANLKIHCESLGKLQLTEQAAEAVCSDCGKEIEQGQEVVVKNASGSPRSWYHRDCFRAIWVSEDWKVHYSSPGFLRMSKKDQ